MKDVNEGGIYAKSRSAWRKWLMKNHLEKDSVWLIYYKKNAGLPSVSYQEAVQEALCFGWIDSKAQSIDEKSYRQYFSRRKPKSVWSAVNKKKVADLIRQGLMKEAGYQSIELAKKTGPGIHWTRRRPSLFRLNYELPGRRIHRLRNFFNC